MLNRDAYLSAFERYSAQLPAAERQTRSAALRRFIDIGLPTTDLEEWKYTDFDKLAGEAVTLAEPSTQPDLAAWRLADADTHVWLNGMPQSSLSPRNAGGEAFGSSGTDIESVPIRPNAGEGGGAGDASHPGFAALNTAFARPGLQLDLAAGQTLEKPIQALLVTQPLADGEMVHLQHRIRLGENARATVLLHDLGLGDATRWLTQTLDIDLAAGAQLQLIRVQDESAGARSWFQATARLRDGARLDAVQIDFGGGIVRNDWRVALLAPGATTAVHGLFAPTGRTHVDNHTQIDHRAPHCTSREFVRGLAWERAHAVFNGKIVVHPGAQKTDSEQRIANLLLSKQAQINAKPELEIYADDVKCAHGATFGRLDLTALFYLRTRGVPEAAARALLTFSFANQILQHIAWPALRQAVTARFLARMGGGLDAGELT
ncbi:MAG: Fe-S cluster assembly protein SufD [Sinimarinibacterium sp.]|jgi:Fe-S cluster assembly protein SufD